jgi:hypothetical protein
MFLRTLHWEWKKHDYNYVDIHYSILCLRLDVSLRLQMMQITVMAAERADSYASYSSRIDDVRHFQKCYCSSNLFFN